MSRERTGSRAEALGSNILVHGRPVPPEELVSKIEAVEADDIRRLVSRLLASAPTLTLLGPCGGVESYASLLERLDAPRPRVAAGHA